MPRAKRPLAEVDPNASSSASTKAAKVEAGKSSKNIGNKSKSDSVSTLPRRSSRGKSQAATKKSQKKSGRKKQTIMSDEPVRLKRYESENDDQEEISMPTGGLGRGSNTRDEASAFSGKEEIDYSTKDNSKLRRFLTERWMSPLGTREEMITRLENSSIDYTTLLSEQMSERLKNRHIRMSSCGSKEVKIQRLRINDMNDRDTGNSEDGELYGKLSLCEYLEKELISRHERAMDKSYNPYPDFTQYKLSGILEHRNLPTSGTKAAQIKRLLADDRKTTRGHVKFIRKEHADTRVELETRIGQPVIASKLLKREEKLRALDYRARLAGTNKHPVHICDYKWQDSEWADKSERELQAICREREMPGFGPKASMIKWLDTGEIEYEDMYVTALIRFCTRRDIHHRSHATKDELVRILREADEAEGGEWEST